VTAWSSGRVGPGRHAGLTVNACSVGAAGSARGPGVDTPCDSTVSLPAVLGVTGAVDQDLSGGVDWSSNVGRTCVEGW
jgi:hypothetical protein